MTYVFDISFILHSVTISNKTFSGQLLYHHTEFLSFERSKALLALDTLSHPWFMLVIYFNLLSLSHLLFGCNDQNVLML